MFISAAAMAIMQSGKQWWQYELFGHLLTTGMEHRHGLESRCARLPPPIDSLDAALVAERISLQMSSLTLPLHQFASEVAARSACFGDEHSAPDLDAIVDLALAGIRTYHQAVANHDSAVARPWNISVPDTIPGGSPQLELAMDQVNDALAHCSASVCQFIRTLGHDLCQRVAQQRACGNRAALFIDFSYVAPINGTRLIDGVRRALRALHSEQRRLAWRNAARAADGKAPADGVRRPGYVYLMLHPDLARLVRVGHTRENVDHHLYEQALAAGGYSRLVLVYVMHCADHPSAAAEVKRRLAPLRWEHQADFFRVSCSQAIEVMLSVRAEQDALCALPAPAPPALAAQPSRLYMASWALPDGHEHSVSVDGVAKLCELRATLAQCRPGLLPLYSLSEDGHVLYVGCDLAALMRADAAAQLASNVLDIARSRRAQG